jgi:hypothetical protein
MLAAIGQKAGTLTSENSEDLTDGFRDVSDPYAHERMERAARPAIMPTHGPRCAKDKDASAGHRSPD